MFLRSSRRACRAGPPFEIFFSIWVSHEFLAFVVNSNGREHRPAHRPILLTGPRSATNRVRFGAMLRSCPSEASFWLNKGDPVRRNSSMKRRVFAPPVQHATLPMAIPVCRSFSSATVYR
jgi:hypothetical protein